METDLLQYPFSIVHYFVPEFIGRMRGSREVQEKPSPRQGIAICDLLLPVYLRKGRLSVQDLVEIAVYTSKVENQGIAEKIALEVLLNVEESEERPPELDEEALLGLLSQKSDDLVSYESTDEDRPGQGEIQPVHDSNVDLFREFTSQPDLGVGPGEDELVKIAIRRNKDRRDERSRRRLAEFLKAKLLKLGREFERSTEELRRPILRPFEYGDDPEDIDEERSLENIFDQGKRMDEVGYDDFLIRKKDRKRKSIVYVLDISNTMFYQAEGLTSIHYSVMSLVPLLWSLRQERFGMILYESNSHVQKDVHEEGDVDEIIDNLLMLVTSTTGDVEKSLRGTKGSRTWGGTVPNNSLKWALEQLDSSGDRTERICFYFGDFVLEDPGVTPVEKMEVFKILERMLERGIHVVACVSPLARGDIFSPYSENVLELLREIGCEEIETFRPSDFLDGVQAFLESI
jgi:hypothetical protein